jgi:3-oxoacyl-[acyl-carrier protein] reductase
MSVNNRVALVTGSSRGLGKVMAFTLGRAGAKVAFNYYNDDALAQKTLDEFKAEGLEGILVKCDVTNADEVTAMVAEIESELGSVDILVPNATPSQPLKAFEDYSWQEYQSMLDFFVKSPFLLTQAVLPGMKKKGWGRIISIGSEVAHDSWPGFTAYSSAKGAQIQWAKCMGKELAPFGITSNVVSPGWILVERHENDSQEDKDEYFATIPMKRWGKPEDVAEAVLYFASEESSFVSGQTLCVNGAKSAL